MNSDTVTVLYCIPLEARLARAKVLSMNGKSNYRVETKGQKNTSGEGGGRTYTKILGEEEAIFYCGHRKYVLVATIENKSGVICMADQTPEENPDAELIFARQRVRYARRQHKYLTRLIAAFLDDPGEMEALQRDLRESEYEIARAVADVLYWERVVNGDWDRMDWRYEENE